MKLTEVPNGEFDKDGRLMVVLPERFYTPLDTEAIVSLQHYPISTSQGDFDGYGFGFYSGKEGDSARVEVMEMINKFMEELGFARSRGIDNNFLIDLAKKTKEYFKKPSTPTTIEDVLTGNRIFAASDTESIPLVMPPHTKLDMPRLELIFRQEV